VKDREWFRWLRRRFREAVRDNQWLLPAAGALTGVLLAMVIGTGGGVETHKWTVTVDRSRDTLLTVLGLVFTALSIVLALASVAAQNVVGRFGSRVLRMYNRRSADRWVIGMFSLAATFILAEQFQLRRLDPSAPAPVAGLAVSVVLLVITGTTMIWYISAVIRWFRVDRTVARIIEVERQTLNGVARARSGSVCTSIPERPETVTDLLAPRSGHLAEIDTNMILRLCDTAPALIVLTPPLGAPVVEGQPIGWVTSRDPLGQLPPEEHIADRLDISGTRELLHSVEYGLFALVDIAIMALSPAINDPNSAVVVIEEMSFLFPEIAKVPLGPYAVPDPESWPRVVVYARSFGELVELATTQIVLYGIADPNVAMALRRFATSLDLLDLNNQDQRYVDEFAAKLESAPTEGISHGG
jgi:uncharacterized membrane protein